MTVTPALRTKLLGALAALGVLAVVADQVIPRGASQGTVAVTPRAGGAGAAPKAPAPAGAPRDLDLDGLRARYAPVGGTKPFDAHGFERPKAPPRAERPRDEGRRHDPSAGRPVERGPEPLSLRLTGFLGQAAQRTAVLEAYGTGKGLLVQGGERYGAAEVAEVRSSSVVVVTAGERRTLDLGDAFPLPPDVSDALVVLHVASKAPAAGASPGAATPDAPKISADERQSILERLRARRRSELGSGAPAEGK